jgi:DNA polymerase-3 subunit delta'
MGIENKQGLISKAESDNIIRKLSLKSFESDYKILIMWLPEKMNAPAANTLLKLVEEPPEKTIFLMVSEEPREVLLTISSRTQPVKLEPIDEPSMKKTLSSIFALNDSQVNSVCRLANGNYIAALEIIETSEETRFNFEHFTSLMRLCYARNFTEISNWVDEMVGIGREGLKGFFEYSLRLIRENFIMNLKNGELLYMTAEEEAFSKKFHPYINGRNIVSIYTEFNQAHADIERNGNSKIILFDMALKLVKSIRN